MKKVYWKMYQDKYCINFNSVILTEEDMIKEVKGFFEYHDEEDDAPIFEPVYMTEEDFKNLPEFEGF